MHGFAAQPPGERIEFRDQCLQDILGPDDVQSHETICDQHCAVLEIPAPPIAE